MIRSSGGRNRSLCRSSRGFAILTLRANNACAQRITNRRKPESQIARNRAQYPASLQNALLAQFDLSHSLKGIRILHGRLNTLRFRGLQSLACETSRSNDIYDRHEILPDARGRTKRTLVDFAVLAPAWLSCIGSAPARETLPVRLTQAKSMTTLSNEASLQVLWAEMEAGINHSSRIRVGKCRL